MCCSTRRTKSNNYIAKLQTYAIFLSKFKILTNSNNILTKPYFFSVLTKKCTCKNNIQQTRELKF